MKKQGCEDKFGLEKLMEVTRKMTVRKEADEEGEAELNEYY